MLRGAESWTANCVVDYPEDSPGERDSVIESESSDREREREAQLRKAEKAALPGSRQAHEPRHVCGIRRAF